MASKWNIFERAEITLERTLKKNPTYPFQVLYTDSEGGLVYAYSKRMAYFYFGSLGCVTSLFFVLFLILFSEGNKDFILFGMVLFLISIWHCFEYYSIRSVVLEPILHQYSLYHGGQLALSRNIHNIYIRIQKRKTGLMEYKFYLMINGWGFETPIIVSRLTTNKAKLRVLGLQLAENLNLNFFDIPDISKQHVIRHPRPQEHITDALLYDVEKND